MKYATKYVGKRMASIVCLIFILCVGSVVYARGNDDGYKGDDVERGMAAYKHHCIQCHGRNGKGNGQGSMLRGVPTGDLSNKAYMSLLSDHDLYERIAYGEKQFAYLQMPGFGDSLSSSTIKDIVAYIRTLEVDSGELKGPTPNERMERFENDPLERGRIYYTRYCSQCHGRDGTGDGWAARRSLGQPERLNIVHQGRQEIVDYVRGRSGDIKDRNMPVFGVTISDDVIDSLTDYIMAVLYKKGDLRYEERYSKRGVSN